MFQPKNGMFQWPQARAPCVDKIAMQVQDLVSVWVL